MRVRELMTPAPVTVPSEMPVDALVDLLVERRVNGVPVVDADGVLLGMVTTGDLIHRVADARVEDRGSFWRESFYKSVFRPNGPEPNPAEGATAAEVMSRNPAFVAPSDDMAVAARLLIEHRVKSLPVLDNGRLVGMISRLDLLRCLRAHPECCNPFLRHD
ncbi:CBS domain protein [Thioalkalivibrio nitratireducens DSM 14787]|uniref:CBS domain protein n=1 Tax=Thioalkalivibrio nitratireducens (strain DSM 14787 / UNIQEM 213 / ALEN2) TaxID=1255043 RepID=L0DUE2_THIND|nr:CBS domain-containing protein [Thioalkalivibrio nitratireducens]AGA32648.1 CBS domain protein [Thioalkalivibrio nitratireducens DSM 14787]